jgi:hypothetical protein
LDVAKYFDGTFVNKFHEENKPFFENVREAYMTKIKYAPCKYCVFDASYNKSDTTIIQSLGKFMKNSILQLLILFRRWSTQNWRKTKFELKILFSRKYFLE